MRQHRAVRPGWYATRTVHMPDDDERGVSSVLFWIEHRADGTWAVGRASDLDQRQFDEPRAQDYVFTGFELDDALLAANNVLEDEVTASEHDGIDENTRPFTRRELEQPLAAWFWGRSEH